MPNKEQQSIISYKGYTSAHKNNNKMDTSALANTSKVFENGTMLGAITENCGIQKTQQNNKLIIPEIVISASYSNNSLNQNHHCDIDNTTTTTSTIVNNRRPNTAEINGSAIESTALLEATQMDASDMLQHEDFEQFMLNRTTSGSNIFESSIYSEVQFPPSIGSDTTGNENTAASADGGGCGYLSSSGGSIAQTAAPQTPSNVSQVDVFNSSACSRQSRHTKRTRRKTHKSKSKCSTGTQCGASALAGATFPPQYTAIYLDATHHHLHNQNGNANANANAMGQIANAAAAAAVAVASPCQNMRSNRNTLGHQRANQRHQRAQLEPTIPAYGNFDQQAVLNVALGTACVPALDINVVRKWFSRPSLPFIIGILALGGVACTLGGIVLGSTGLIEHSTQYLSAALLMIGIGVSLLVISGAIWRLSLPDDVDECPCYRHMETCRNCNSPFCNSRLMPGSYFYPEFQHRPPPPSYLTSLNECAAMGLLFHPAAQDVAACRTLRINTPPPLYRSTNSLSVFMPATNSTATITAPTSSTAVSTATNTNPNNNLNVVMEHFQATSQALTKEINYLELD